MSGYNVHGLSHLALLSSVLGITDIGAAATDVLSRFSPTSVYDSAPCVETDMLRKTGKVRGSHMQGARFGNKPGKYMPHQGAQEMARRRRQIANGQIDAGQRA